MIRVEIVEHGPGLVARCTIRAKKGDEFRADLSRLKSIPLEMRDYDGDLRIWSIYEPEKWVSVMPEIGKALEIHNRQLRMF